jgi:peptidoglycan hydrolase-like protein with peptidoglycan-binding domain
MDDGDDLGGRRALRPLWWRVLVRHPRDTLIGVVAAAAMTAIVVNGLFLQPGPHPAPIFSVRPPPVAAREATGATGAAIIPRPRPAEAAPARRDAMPPARSRGEIIADVQRELARRGFYDGAIDGLYGARTDAAIRDFEQSAGMKATGEPSEALLQAILRFGAKGKAAAMPAPPRRDVIAELISPANSRQIMAVQRALSDFGYGQIKATGVFDADTRAAIERFERERKLPVSGQISDQLMRELAGMTGRPLD